MTDSMTFSFRPPGPLLSMNDRLHWRPKARLVRQWRDATNWAARESISRPPATAWSTASRTFLPASIVQVVLPVPDRRHRDPHNFFATVKPIVDGLVDARLWPDDTPEHVTTVEPALVYANPSAWLVTVVITPRSPA